MGVTRPVFVGLTSVMGLPFRAKKIRMIRRTALKLLFVLAAGALSQDHADASRRWFRSKWIPFIATAYSTEGETASQTTTEAGRTVAADPDVLPIGTVIDVRNAGPYSGEYVVQDTGDKIIGRKIDIFIPTRAAAKEFGKKPVRVRIVKPAPETPKAQREAAADATLAPKPVTPPAATPVH